MDIQKASELINKFVSDERFPLVSLYNQSRHIFDVLGLGENKLSTVIAWLLDPREGHGLGDYFIKEMLRDAIVNGGAPMPLNSLDICSLKFDNLNVQTEYLIHDKKRLDFLLTDIDNKLVVIIEHKYGSSEHNNQLKAYSQWAETLTEQIEEYHLIRILMDGYGPYDKNKIHPDEQNKWACTSHDWLISALKNIVDSERVSPAINLIFKDLLIHLSGNYVLDKSLKRTCKQLASMASTHSELVGNFKDITLTLPAGDSDLNLAIASDIDVINLMSELETPLSPAVLNIRHFLQKNFTLLANLEDYAKLEWVKETLDTRHPDIFEFEFSSGKDAAIKIFHTAWQPYRKDKNNYWPFYLSVTDMNTESETELESGYNLTVHMQKEGLMNEAIADKLAAAYNTKLNVNWKWKKMTNRIVDVKPQEQEQLIQQILGDLDRLGSYVQRLSPA
ncbi:PD-(D/E)XK nuclease family protein [Pelagibaculum spongiae]|uniref:PD-(D/E)XK nuclease superfamily protein n=1 Tax=Pelagibaculum spongiae TaxID=2080658 RepID=A0A2V1GPG0_9GAMM|nr:PD-(D/E)XK nuclease family protein [Pelagibaculum spongiae]PVZ64517.1 hypothetical protein DC094_19590 [Pelagibaculum spongiae]